ncbi:MAG: ABC transporter permease [Acidobacteria bacterium]|nr:ABC transporter permease [Acidobacteriota bacterium]
MRALRYFFNEATESLWRGRRAAIVAVVTIAAGLFVLGLFLVVNTNVQQLVGRWSEAAELSVYLKERATSAEVQAVDDLVSTSGLSASRQYVSKTDAAKRFREDFPDLAVVAGGLDRNPFPASVEVRLTPAARGAGDAVDALAANLGALPGVADVRYDRRWLGRLNAAITLVRGVGLLIIGMLSVAAALTVANVVRLAAHARRDEIEIMQLVGAPFAYVRGPFIVEGILQGGAGALLAISLLGVLFAVARARFQTLAVDALGLTSVVFMPPELWVVILLGGMVLGCIGGVIVARGVR